MKNYDRLTAQQVADLFLEYMKLHDKLILNKQKHLADMIMPELEIMRKQLHKRGLRND